MPGLDDYGSPILRMAVFRQLNPGAQVYFSVVPIGQAFPPGHFDYEGKATEAVKCEIILANGSFIVAFKEIDKKDRGKDIAQTPEQLAKDETKCLGRALRTAGIPQRLSELKILMQWVASMNGSPGRTPETGERTALETITSVFPDSTVEDDAADAGTEEPTSEQVLAQRFSRLPGADKMIVAKYARETFDVANVMRAGEHADTLLDYIERAEWLIKGAAVPVETLIENLDQAVKTAKAAKAAAKNQEPEAPF